MENILLGLLYVAAVESCEDKFIQLIGEHPNVSLQPEIDMLDDFILMIEDSEDFFPDGIETRQCHCLECVETIIDQAFAEV